MKESQTFGIQFIVRKNKEKETSLRIFARITINGVVSEISLKQNISPKDWNPAAEMGKGRRAEIKTLNQFLDQVRTRLNSIYRKLMVEDDLPSNISKNLTFHLARHTFATTVTLSNGGPLLSIFLNPTIPS